ncbi:BppU family phage baseplate upper protein, partial [Enterococcus casseliflavus]|uniref:BppU family phage baseplate upper protein n=1 Tax=Enterococcus casseliflavus TaxID=37734 RepID=UPI0039A609FA
MSLTNFKNADLTINNINTTYIPKQYASEGDYLGRTLTVQITDDGLIGRIDGAQLVLHWKNIASGLSDDSAFTLIDAEKAIFRIEYPQNMLTPGTVKANILVIYQGKTTVSREFEITVANVAGQSTGVLAKAEFSALVAVLADSNKFRTDIDTMNATKANKTELKVVEDKADENIAKLQGDLTSEIGIKVDKNGSGQVTWANLAQDARNNISGNKVATVGTDSVLEGSITDGAVTLPKIGFNPFNVVRYEHLNFEERKIGYDKNACLTLNEELSGRALHSYQIQINKTGDMVRACKIYFRLETSSDSARVYFAPYDQNDIVVANLLGFST